MRSAWVNNQLKKLQDAGCHRFLERVIYFMYQRRGKDIKEVTFLKDKNVWEFKIGEDFFYSSGPGWVYDYEYLLRQFSLHLGFHYLPRPGDCVVDVGAGVGEELMIFSRSVGSQGKVYAIEAHPKTFEVLEYNCRKNGLRNAELLNVAIADKPGSIFIEDSRDSLANTVSEKQHAGSHRVEAVTIDQLVNRYGIERINLMKVNIEGAEQLLVKGIGPSISKIDHMAISCHDFRFHNEGNTFFKTREIVQEFLRDHDFECITRDTNNPLLDDYVYAYARPERNKESK